MWVKSRKVGPGKRQQRWDDGPLAIHEREAQRRRRVRELLRERLTKYRAAVGVASRRSDAAARSNALALALGMLPLEPSHVVRLGREIEARSASSCCERPVRLRAARNMPPVISTIVMLRLFARRQRTSMSAYFTNSLTPPARLDLLASPCGWFPGRAARGSVVPRKVACCPAAGELAFGSRPSTRARRGSL